MKRVLLNILFLVAAFAAGIVTHRAYMPTRLVILETPADGGSPSSGPSAPGDSGNTA